jgi:hypothetical protein
VLVLGPGGGRKLGAGAAAVADWLLKAGGRALAIGLDEEDAAALGPIKVTIKKAEHIAAVFETPAAGSAFAGVGPADVHNRDPRPMPLVVGGAAVLGDGVLAKTETAGFLPKTDAAGLVFCQLVPWEFDYSKQYNLKRTYRRASFLVTRLLANLGAAGPTPLLSRFSSPVDGAKPEKRWLDGLYLDPPEEMDDPYRFFRW